MTRVLVVDDVRAMAEQYAYDLKRVGGFVTTVAVSGDEALDTLGKDPIDCVVLDLEMPGTDGFEVLRHLKHRGIDTPVIVYTGTGTYDRCVQAVRLGAYGFIDKAERIERVVQEVESAVSRGQLVTELRTLRARLDDESSLIGDSDPMQRLAQGIARVAGIPSTVLIVGESGTGKELVARELHRLRAGRSAPLVTVNSAALPDQLVESELFGHERGAFTGADRLRKGAFETAGEGTLFLDEIGELPLAAQAKLLRVLEQQEVTRVGGSRVIAVRARVVAATNRDLEQEVDAGRFRQDLLYRLNVHVLSVPPLRERRADVPALTEHLLKVIAMRFRVRPKPISPAALGVLSTHDWRKNNVRELRNCLERMMIASESTTLDVDDVPAEIRSRVADDHDAVAEAGGPDTTSPAGGFKARKAEAERQIVLDALNVHEWHITQTAEALGLADHSSLLKIMRRHKLTRP